ncbi:hypothetical protein [Rhodanobacter lindaniclasticus]
MDGFVHARGNGCGQQRLVFRHGGDLVRPTRKPELSSFIQHLACGLEQWLQGHERVVWQKRGQMAMGQFQGQRGRRVQGRKVGHFGLAQPTPLSWATLAGGERERGISAGKLVEITLDAALVDLVTEVLQFLVQFCRRDAVREAGNQ